MLYQKLWGDNARLSYLLLASIAILFVALGGREIWNLETRWANIVLHMQYVHDYFHPVLRAREYYAKPLLSYWFIDWASYLTGGLNLWSLRLPSALAGLLSVFCTYFIGKELFNRQTGLLAGWLLITTYYFVFWSRVASADILNVAGMLAAIAWYIEFRNSTQWKHYAGFWMIIAITCLTKGLLGLVLPFLFILPDLCQQKRWREHLNPRIFTAMIPALIVYALPFLISTWTAETYVTQGLWFVLRENFIRFFAPFDHVMPFYVYFGYAPVYTLPWALLLIPFFVWLARHWRTSSYSLRWVAWATLLFFLFFTASGSRRSYYILPIAPLIILLLAAWGTQLQVRYQKYLAYAVLSMAGIIILIYGVLFPLYYGFGGYPVFSKEVQASAQLQQPWDKWHVVFLDAADEVQFYLRPEIQPQFMEKRPDISAQTTVIDIASAWPVVAHPPADTIFVTQTKYTPYLDEMLPNYQRIDMPPTLGKRLSGKKSFDTAVAYVPKAPVL